MDLIFYALCGCVGWFTGRGILRVIFGPLDGPSNKRNYTFEPDQPGNDAAQPPDLAADEAGELGTGGRRG